MTDNLIQWWFSTQMPGPPGYLNFHYFWGPGLRCSDGVCWVNFSLLFTSLPSAFGGPGLGEGTGHQDANIERIRQEQTEESCTASVMAESAAESMSTGAATVWDFWFSESGIWSGIDWWGGAQPGSFAWQGYNETGNPMLYGGGSQIASGVALTSAALAGAVGTVEWMGGATQLHHVWPRYLGGPQNGPTVNVNTGLHKAYHRFLSQNGLPAGGKYSTAYYRSLDAATQAQKFQKFSECTGAFDAAHGTNFWQTLVGFISGG